MTDSNLNQPAGLYLEKNFNALDSLKVLFTVSADGGVDFVDPNNGPEIARDVIADMKTHADDSIEVSGRITGHRDVRGPSKRMAEALATAEGIEMDFSKLQALFRNAVLAKKFWKQDADAIVEQYRDFLQQNPSEFKAA